MSRQCFQTFPSLHVPYPHTLIKLEAKKTAKPNRLFKSLLLVNILTGVLDLHSISHRSRHDEVGLGVEVAAEHIVAVAFQGF